MQGIVRIILESAMQVLYAVNYILKGEKSSLWDIATLGSMQQGINKI